MQRVTIRALREEDAAAARALLARARPCGWEPPGDPWLLAQTGSRFLVALSGEQLAGLVRWWDDEGIAWLDWLASDVPGAGRELVRAVGRAAQDAGLRLARLRAPENGALPDYFGRLGYRPIGRERADDGSPLLLMERRLPLLTVREQRRTDAAAIGELTGEDPWVFEQGARPGWFVAADGDRVVGVIGMRDAGGGVAELREPVLLDEYRGRGLELWMIERVALYASTNGFHTGRVPASGELSRHERDLEDRRWFREGGEFVRHFASGGERIGSEEWD